MVCEQESLRKYLSTACAGIFKQSIGARNQLGIGLSYRPARLHSLAELVPWNRFMGSLKIKKFGLWIMRIIYLFSFYCPYYVS
jgi:hypothetical protein